MPDVADAYQALLTFLYRAPIAVVQSRLDGAIEMMTPRAAQLLVPLAASGQPDNLLDLLEPHLPGLGQRVQQAAAANAMVCDGARFEIRDPRNPRVLQVLALSVLKMDGQGLMALLVDATQEALRQAAERRESEHKLSELAASLDEALATMSIALAREDLATGRIFPNERLRAWLGIPELKSLGSMEEFLGCVHPDDRAVCVEDHRRAVEGRQAGFREFRIRRPDGAVAHLAGRRFLERDAQGQPVRLTTFAVDVTEQRAAEHERLVLAERLKLATEAAAIGTFEIERHSGRILWNEQACALFGHEGAPPDDARRVLDRCLSPRERASFDHWVAGLFAGAAGSTIEFRVQRHDGQTRWLASKGRLQSDAHGMAVSLIGVIWDVTDQRVAAEREQARRVAEQANRAKTEFLSRMSHELRTPLNAILGFSEILLTSREPALAPRQSQQVIRIRDSGRHLLELIGDLLDVSRIESGRLELNVAEVNLMEVLQSALNDTERGAHARGLRVATPPGPPVARVLADPVRLRQVLLNLLTNAIKYNRDGGSIELRVAPSDHGWRLSVIDSGIGMSATQVQGLYTPFDRLGRETSTVEGVGIGLVITRQLVEAMHGRLTVISTPGVGTQFDLDLQAAARGLPGPLADSAQGEVAMREDVVGRVLAAEDNPVSAEVLRGFLEWRPNVTLDIVDTAEACLQAALAAPPDLVLLDVQLPDMLGTDLLKRLRQEAAPRRLPCIFVSAQTIPVDVATARETRYLTKPISLPELLLEIDLLLGTGPA